MASISSLPRPEASAMAEPVMPEKTREARTLTCARPPRKRPTRPMQVPKTYSVILPAFITFAAKINNGTATMVPLVNIASMVFCATRCRLPPAPVMSAPKPMPLIRPSVRKYSVHAAIMPAGIGIRSTNMSTNVTRNTIRGRCSSIYLSSFPASSVLLTSFFPSSGAGVLPPWPEPKSMLVRSMFS